MISVNKGTTYTQTMLLHCVPDLSQWILSLISWIYEFNAGDTINRFN